MNDSVTDSIYAGLQALAASSFPKKCNNCGRVYHTVESFITETERINNSVSGLTSSTDEDGSKVVELFRNCVCGSTLMDAFNDRRDLSEKGEQRRNNFDRLLNMVQTNYNIDKSTAREELLKIMRGERSDIIKNILPAKGS